MGCFLIYRKHYILNDAANILGCGVNDLIHLAASERLRIHVLTAGVDASNYLSEIDDSLENEPLPDICLVPKFYWRLTESNNYQFAKLEYLYREDFEDFEGEEVIDDELWSSPWIDLYGNQVELKTFVIFRKELEKLQQQDDISTPNHEPSSELDDLESWQEFKRKAASAVREFPEWKKTQRIIQKQGNLKEWVKREFKTTASETEVIKNFVIQKYKL